MRSFVRRFRMALAMVACSLCAMLGAVGAPGPGLAVGEKAPTFTLKDQDGQDRSLDSLLAGGPVALVFYRSADW